jgi:hypothetical protein
MRMREFAGFGRFGVPVFAVALILTGCHKTDQQNAEQAQSQPAEDPAAANLAPASNVTRTASNQNPPPPPADNGSSQDAEQAEDQTQYPSQGQDQYANQPADNSGYDETAYDVAPQPPPELPDYDQPPCPGDNYIWTPGYWSYAPQGYYWVPGAWVLAPFVGALWTPGYWGYEQNRYRWHPGFWGRHVGYYGGIDYGHGYNGRNYEGGYWRNNQFYYNRDVTRVNETVIHNVYNYKVVNNYNTTRVSYDGGRGGLNVRPTSQQEEARRETHIAPLPVQRQLVQTARQNRDQFADVNHGHPQRVAESQPMNGGRPAPAPNPQRFHPTPEPRQAIGQPGENNRVGSRAPAGGERQLSHQPAQQPRNEQERRYPTGQNGAQTEAHPTPRPGEVPRQVNPSEPRAEQQQPQREHQRTSEQRLAGQEQSRPAPQAHPAQPRPEQQQRPDQEATPQQHQQRSEQQPRTDSQQRPQMEHRSAVQPKTEQRTQQEQRQQQEQRPQQEHTRQSHQENRPGGNEHPQ